MGNFLANIPDFDEVATFSREKPTHTSSELQAAREAGYAEGEVAGIATGRAAAEEEYQAEVTRLVSRMAQDITALMAAEDQRALAVECDILRLGLSLAQKLAPALMQRGFMDELENMLSERLSLLVESQHLIIRLPAALAQEVEARLDQDPRMATLKERLILKAEMDLPAHECRLDWGTGGLVRDPERFWHEVKQIAHALTEGADCDDIRAKLSAAQNVHPEKAPTDQQSDKETDHVE